MNYEEVSEPLRAKDLMYSYDYKYVRLFLDEYYTDYDCKIITDKLKTFRLNREVQYLINRYSFNFQQAIDKLVDTGILKLY